ncbi:hypothetical protein TGPRC2_262440 [Toxoplasma gondii TgCatPRC2]|uniref:Uncharacterized protein n=1 Tax=Toxoplasma gondii TgCatPRC2 TaxID=1130821 RepID=A0A151HMQ8_TOXGO|nr:hypothetical protein TGPRC2_262440 [Toxoplasma gondii TgCatPRC2]
MILHCLIRSHSRRLKSEAFSLIRYYSWGMRAVEEEAAACEATIKRVQQTEKLRRSTGTISGDDLSSNFLPLRLRGVPRMSQVEECGTSERRCSASMLDAPASSLNNNFTVPKRAVTTSSAAHDYGGIFIRRNSSGQAIVPSSASVSDVGQAVRAPRRDRTILLPPRGSPRRPQLGPELSSLDSSGRPPDCWTAPGRNVSDRLRNTLRQRIYEPRTEEAPCCTPPVCSRPRYSRGDLPEGSSPSDGHCCDSDTREPEGSRRRRHFMRPGLRETGELSTGASPAASSSSFDSHTWRLSSLTEHSSFVENCGGSGGPEAGDKKADRESWSSRGYGRDRNRSPYCHPNDEKDDLVISYMGGETASLACRGDFDLTVNARQASPFFSRTARQVASYFQKPYDQITYCSEALPRPLDHHSPGSPNKLQDPSEESDNFNPSDIRLRPTQSPCPPVTITYKSEKQSIWEDPKPEEEKIRARVHVVGRNWPPPMAPQFLPS